MVVKTKSEKVLQRTDILIGADPEYFVKKGSVFIPAEFTGVKGTKKKPSPLAHGGAVQIDGMALEFNIQPALDHVTFDTRIDEALRDIRAIVSPEYDFAFVPVADFEEAEWNRASKTAKRLGCDPDYDAYKMRAKTPPQGAAAEPMRTASGHIHIGYTEGMDPKDPRHIYDCSVISQLLDSILGIFEKYWDPDTRRKEVYGQFGSFRPKPYGLEYRVLSNAWVDKPELRKFIFEYVKSAVKKLLDGRSMFQYPLNKLDDYTRLHSGLYSFICSTYYHGNSTAWEMLKSLISQGKVFIRQGYEGDLNYYLHMGDHEYRNFGDEGRSWGVYK